MKNNLRIAIVGLILNTAIVGLTFAQKDNVGIGTTKPDQSAVLDISSSNKGLLTPRMSLQQRSFIQNPAEGLIVYQTDMLSGFYFYDGKEWKAMTTQNSVAGVDGDWTTSGNSLTGTEFIGSTNYQKLVFKTSNTQSGVISPDGNVFFGFNAGLTNFEGVNVGIGMDALKSNVAGQLNVAIGFQALKNNNNGHQNVAIGNLALLNNTTGGQNFAMGAEALKSNTIGTNNMALGISALSSNTTGIYNTAIGGNALLNNTTGSTNIAIGGAALFANTTGQFNTAIGTSALQQTTTNNNNTAIGFEAMKTTNGGGNIAIGYQAGYSETGSDKLYIANSNTATPLVYGDFSAKYLAVGEVTASDRAANTSGGYRLLVKGGMITEKIKVATSGTPEWADYVFESDYKIMPLEDVDAYIKENKHLPNVPTTQEIAINGNDLGKTDAKLLEKIEELTLYVIELNKEIKKLKENKK